MSIFKKSDPKTVRITKHALKCPVCDNKMFYTRKAQLNTSVATFFNLDWASRTATCYVCSECTHISWFLGKR